MPEMELETEETDMPEKAISQTEYSRCTSCEILTECGSAQVVKMQKRQRNRT